jgi:hypothetical protein
MIMTIQTPSDVPFAQSPSGPQPVNKTNAPAREGFTHPDGTTKQFHAEDKAHAGKLSGDRLK